MGGSVFVWLFVAMRDPYGWEGVLTGNGTEDVGTQLGAGDGAVGDGFDEGRHAGTDRANRHGLPEIGLGSAYRSQEISPIFG